MARLNRTWRRTPSAVQASSSCASLLSSPSSSVAMKLGSCFLTEKKKTIQAFEALLLGTHEQGVGASQIKCHRIIFGQETERLFVWACHAPRQHLQKATWRVGDAAGGGENVVWATLKRVSPLRCPKCSWRLSAKRLDRDLYWIVLQMTKPQTRSTRACSAHYNPRKEACVCGQYIRIIFSLWPDLPEWYLPNNLTFC